MGDAAPIHTSSLMSKVHRLVNLNLDAWLGNDMWVAQSSDQLMRLERPFQFCRSSVFVANLETVPRMTVVLGQSVDMNISAKRALLVQKLIKHSGLPRVP
jgi:hypothetical protein